MKIQVVAILALLVTYALSALQCSVYTLAKTGEDCSRGDLVNPITVNKTVTCIDNLACAHPTLKCTAPVLWQTTCTDDKNCTHPILKTCILGKCGVKRGLNEPCSGHPECYSEICTAGKCAALAFGATCVSDANCTWSLDSTTMMYCHTTNKTCMNYAAEGESCANGIQCNPNTLQCSTDSKCVKKKTLNEDCSVISCLSAYFCDTQDTKKCIDYNSRAKGEKCFGGYYCKSGLACDVLSQRCDFNYMVNCNNGNMGSRCKGLCNCVNGTETDGVCGELAASPCATEKTAMDNCISTKCGGRGSFWYYLSGGCVETNCKSTRNAYFCCGKNKITNFVNFPEFKDADCSQISDSKPPATKTPTKSDASMMSINIVTVLLIIASILL